MKTLVKKSILTALCGLSLLVGGTINGMQQESHPLTLKTLALLALVPIAVVTGAVALITMENKEINSDPTLAFFKNPPKGMEFNYRKHVELPRENQQKESNHKAPEYVQKFALEYARAMCRPGNQQDLEKFEYLKEHGYFIVYDGPDKNQPNYFSENKAGAYAKDFNGIFFPKGSFNGSLSNWQRFALCHEVAHKIHGDNMLVNHDYNKGNKTWFKWEYRADKKALKTLYKLKDYNAIVTQIKSIIYELKDIHLNFLAQYKNGAYDEQYKLNLKNLNTDQFIHPYHRGTIDAFVKLVINNPQDKEFLALYLELEREYQPLKLWTLLAQNKTIQKSYPSFRKNLVDAFITLATSNPEDKQLRALYHELEKKYEPMMLLAALTRQTKPQPIIIRSSSSNQQSFWTKMGSTMTGLINTNSLLQSIMPKSARQEHLRKEPISWESRHKEYENNKN